MRYKFYAYGHPNILATHKTTIEFTKDKEITLKGDCIAGVNADFELHKIKNFIRQLKTNKISIKISNNKIRETISARVNPDFSDDRELVIRKTNFISKRTLGISSNKAALDLSMELMTYLKEKRNKITIVIENRR